MDVAPASAGLKGVARRQPTERSWVWRAPAIRCGHPLARCSESSSRWRPPQGWRLPEATSAPGREWRHSSVGTNRWC
jgi:hypothetical protein